MKTIATLATIAVLAACTSVPPASTASSPAQVAMVAETASRPVADKPADNLVTTAKPKRVCESEESLGSRLKRPRCYDVTEDNEKAYRNDILKDNVDELRQLNERTTIQTTQDIFAK